MMHLADVGCLHHEVSYCSCVQRSARRGSEVPFRWLAGREHFSRLSGDRVGSSAIVVGVFEGDFFAFFISGQRLVSICHPNRGRNGLLGGKETHSQRSGCQVNHGYRLMNE